MMYEWHCGMVVVISDIVKAIAPLAPVYDTFVLQNPLWATIFAPLHNSITCQAIELESCSNLQKMRQVFWFWISKIGKFWILVGDIINGIGLGICGWGHWAMIPKHKIQFLTQVFIGN